jgi:hypothetical protein
MRTSLVLAVPVLGTLLLTAGSAFPSPPQRSYVAGHFMLSLDGGGGTGFLQAVSGGGVSADVVTEPDPSNPLLSKKQIGRPKYEDCAVQLEVGDSAVVIDWVESMLAGKPTRKSGAIVSADFNWKERGRLAFTDALITEIVIPSCDGASKDPAYMKLTITPETTEWTAGTGASLEAAKNTKQKAWLPSNFRLKVGDLPCSRVSKIDSFTIKMGVKEGDVGSTREPQKEPTKIEIPNLKITLDAVDAPAWEEWFDDFCIKGNNGEGAELGGSLTFLAPDLKTELMTLELSHVGIAGLSHLPEPGADAKDSQGSLVVRIYVERIQLLNSK